MRRSQSRTLRPFAKVILDAQASALNPLPGKFGRRVALDFRAVVRERSAVFDKGGGLARAGDGRVVEAAAGVLANLAQFAEALEAGLEADGAARHVGPA